MGKLSEALKGIALPNGADGIVAEADRLLTEWPEHAAYVQYLESEVQRLRSKSGESGASANLTFDATTGTYAGKEGLRYCARCITKDDKRSPLQNDAYGWKCPVCGKSYRDPSRPTPQVVLKPRGGGQSWMGS